nr:hypothetical protein [Candidatus Levybacteria bacterium]
MAGKEQIAPEGKFLINLTKAQMIIGAGLILVPGLGHLGALSFINGGIEYLIIQYAKRQGDKERKGK